MENSGQINSVHFPVITYVKIKLKAQKKEMTETTWEAPNQSQKEAFNAISRKNREDYITDVTYDKYLLSAFHPTLNINLFF